MGQDTETFLSLTRRFWFIILVCVIAGLLVGWAVAPDDSTTSTPSSNLNVFKATNSVLVSRGGDVGRTALYAIEGPVPTAVATQLGGSFAPTVQSVNTNNPAVLPNGSSANATRNARQAPSPSEADAANRPRRALHSISFQYGGNAVTVSAFPAPSARTVRITAQTKNRAEAVRVANMVADELKQFVPRHASELSDAHLERLQAQRAAAGAAVSRLDQSIAQSGNAANKSLTNRRARAARDLDRIGADITDYTAGRGVPTLVTLEPASAKHLDVVTYHRPGSSSTDTPSTALSIAIGGLLGLLLGFGVLGLMTMFSSPRRDRSDEIDLREHPEQEPVTTGDGDAALL